MANAKYDVGLELVAAAAVNWVTDTVRLRLVPSTYTFSAAHATMSDVGAGIGTDQPATSKSVVKDGTNHFAFWKSAATPSWGVIAAGSTIGGAVAYKFNTNDGDSIPICFYDTANLATSGTEITVVWPDDSLGGALKVS